MRESKSNIDLARLSAVLDNLLRPFIEIAYGISSDSIDWLKCIWPGIVFNLLVLWRLDHVFWKAVGLSNLLPPRYPTGFGIYWFLGATSGFLAWGIYQTALYHRTMKRLTEVFQTAGLKNAIGKLPNFVFDRPIDDSTRKLRLTRANLAFSQFKAAKESLESALQIYIDEMLEQREGGTVDIIYASQPMPGQVLLNLKAMTQKDSFLIGESRSKQLIYDFKQTPHLLIGGQSGGGKSTFLRQLITTLYVNNGAFRFILIDLKGGLEFQLFQDLPRVLVKDTPAKAIDSLQHLEEELENRIRILKLAEVKDLEAYQQLEKEKRKDIEQKERIHQPFSRIITVIDEAAELFMVGDKAQAANAQKAKALAIKLAAQGRAAGIHLVIATQRPDVRAIDGQIKGNLAGALAFQMPNHASSMTILDNTRASTLPKVPGRAVWKSGMEMVELQTPFLSVEEANLILDPLRKKKVENA